MKLFEKYKDNAANVVIGITTLGFLAFTLYVVITGCQ